MLGPASAYTRAGRSTSDAESTFYIDRSAFIHFLNQVGLVRLGGHDVTSIFALFKWIFIRTMKGSLETVTTSDRQIPCCSLITRSALGSV